MRTRVCLPQGPLSLCLRSFLRCHTLYALFRDCLATVILTTVTDITSTKYEATIRRSPFHRRLSPLVLLSSPFIVANRLFATCLLIRLPLTRTHEGAVLRQLPVWSRDDTQERGAQNIVTPQLLIGVRGSLPFFSFFIFSFFHPPTPTFIIIFHSLIF